MRTARVFLTIVAVLFVTSLLATDAHAQATRTWVSGVGDDANPCSRTAPCKTFAGAISKTAAGGEISALDPAGFGVVTITKSITINGEGTLAGILSAITNGVIVNAGVNDKVILRSISINGAGSGINGIRYLAGAELLVDNVTINGCTTNGIDMSLSGNGQLHVVDTRITGCATGINVASTGGLAAASIDNVRLAQMTTGVNVGANGRINIRNSYLVGNTGNGVLLNTSTSVANIVNSILAFSGSNGVLANASGASARLSGNAFFNNSTGLNFVAGGIVASDGTNVFAGNGANGTPNGAGTVTRQ